LAFLIDLGEDNYLGAFDTLYRELEAFSGELTLKRRVIVGTKLDLENTVERLEELRKRYPKEKVFGISVFSGLGLQELAALLNSMVEEEEPA
jgi:GTP-binding protein